jgi:hypothetical protein
MGMVVFFLLIAAAMYVAVEVAMSPLVDDEDEGRE